MADKNASAAAAVLERDRGHEFKEPCCIHTKKIYDACRDKDYSSYNCLQEQCLDISLYPSAICNRPVGVWGRQFPSPQRWRFLFFFGAGQKR